MPASTAELRNAYVTIINTVWGQSRLGWVASDEDTCNNVCNYIDGCWNSMFICNAGMAQMADWLKAIFWPTSGVKKAFRNCLKEVYDTVAAGQAAPGETFMTAIEQWANFMTIPAATICLNAMYNTSSPYIAGMLIMNMGTHCLGEEL